MRSSMRMLVVGAVLALPAVACGDDGGGDQAGGPTSASITTTSLPTPLGVEVTEDVRYHDDIDGYREPLLDVYAPTEGGPWPVVLMWHGGGGGTWDKGQLDLLATLVAEQGAVVMTPTFGVTEQENQLSVPAIDPPYWDVLAQQRACALGFVGERAGDYGGDPTDSIAFGSSGGGAMAARAVYDDNQLDEGCVVDAEPVVPHTLVLHEADLMLTPVWDSALATGQLDYEEVTVWDDLVRSDETDVYVLAGPMTDPDVRISVGDAFADEECGRTIEPGTGIDLPDDGECVWWGLRDPDGSFRVDAERLGLFEDGWFHVGEEGLVLADRLEALGQDPTVTAVEGISHNLPPQEATLLAPALIDIIHD